VKLLDNLGGFFTKKAVLDVKDEKQDTMYEEMDKIDNLYIVKEETPKGKKKKVEEIKE
jgi:hypothetical protein